VANPASRDSDSPASVTVLAAHARHVPAAERERLADGLRAALDPGGLQLETCHRVEGYAAGDLNLNINVPAGAKVLWGEAAIRHAIAVAAGRDSVVVGEDQILHQIRVAVDGARASGLDPALERLFATALRAGRRARSWDRGPERSLATVAIAAVERLSGPIRGRRILVVGAGRMGGLVARAAAAAGASVVVANRSPERAEVLAREMDGTTAPSDAGAQVADLAGLILAIGGPWTIGPETARALLESATPVVDLSVPAAVPADVAAGLGTRLVTADDLARIEIPQPDERHLRRLDALIDQATADYLAWVDGGHRRAAAATLARRANDAREAELAVLWRQLPDLDPASRAAIDAMTRHLAERLLREPLERLGQDDDGRTERAVREVFAL
jgi:glutamyl-tRNA reductase